MSKIKTLEVYTSATQAVKEFKEKNKKIFDQYDALLILVSDAEAALKVDVRENLKANIANDFVRVTYSPAFSKGYNIDTILRMLNGKQKKEMYDMGAIVVTETVVKEKIEEAVEKGIIPVDVKQEAYEEKELSPRITIKEQ